jgi:hypothetical protein
MPDMKATEFAEAVRGFLAQHGVEDVAMDANLAQHLDSLRLVALLRFIENLRGTELDDVPEFDEFTLDNCYRLYLGAAGYAK